MRATVSDTRSIVGKLIAFDKHMNLILADAEEYRIVKAKDAQTADREEKRTLGLVLLRGECVISLSVVSRPAQNESRAKVAHVPGAGVGRSAGRGILQAPTGLAAMPPGLGAPPTGFMAPPGGLGMPPGMAGLPGMPPGLMMPPLGMPMPPGFGRGFNPMSGVMLPPGFAAPPPGFGGAQQPPQ
jgi:small nuclear ribonucleoprotein B and B'